MDLYDKDIRSQGMYAIANEIKGLLGNTKETKRQIGVLLQRVRDHLKQDKLFGKWRSLNFNDQLPQPTAYNYMTLASFGEDTGNIPESALYVLGRGENELYADDIIDKLKAKQKVTLQDVKDALSDAKGEPKRTRTDARRENEDEKIDTMFRELSCMDGYCVERLFLLMVGLLGGNAAAIRLLQDEAENATQDGVYYSHAGGEPSPSDLSPQRTVLPLATQLAVAQINEAWYKGEYERLLAESPCF
ncbi:MAG TPA: hypothetical protein VET88_06505 [Gammaproteobacteria bacterium]|nr:hypothetical protein [Gammaproteobacteria bacterium]